jgi:hypothetical protein
MNTRLSTFHLAVAATLATLAAPGALAHQESTEYGIYHWVGHVRDGNANPAPAPQAGDNFDPSLYAESGSIYRIQAQIAGSAGNPGMAGPLRTDSGTEVAVRQWDRWLGPVSGRNTH